MADHARRIGNPVIDQQVADRRRLRNERIRARRQATAMRKQITNLENQINGL